MGVRVVSGAWASGKVAPGGLSAAVLSMAVGAPDFSSSPGDSVVAKAILPVTRAIFMPNITKCLVTSVPFDRPPQKLNGSYS
jgi:hypothetical protein